MSSEKKIMQACFVNSDELPLKVSEPKAFFVRELDRYGFVKEIDKNTIKIEELVLFSIREYTYPHPDAKENAIVTVLVDQVEKRARIGDRDWSAIYLLFHAQENLKK